MKQVKNAFKVGDLHGAQRYLKNVDMAKAQVTLSRMDQSRPEYRKVAGMLSGIARSAAKWDSTINSKLANRAQSEGLQRALAKPELARLRQTQQAGFGNSVAPKPSNLQNLRNVSVPVAKLANDAVAKFGDTTLRNMAGLMFKFANGKGTIDDALKIKNFREKVQKELGLARMSGAPLTAFQKNRADFLEASKNLIPKKGVDGFIKAAHAQQQATAALRKAAFMEAAKQKAAKEKGQYEKSWKASDKTFKDLFDRSAFNNARAMLGANRGRLNLTNSDQKAVADAFTAFHNKMWSASQTLSALMHKQRNGTQLTAKEEAQRDYLQNVLAGYKMNESSAMARRFQNQKGLAGYLGWGNRADMYRNGNIANFEGHGALAKQIAIGTGRTLATVGKFGLSVGKIGLNAGMLLWDGFKRGLGLVRAGFGKLVQWFQSTGIPAVNNAMALLNPGAALNWAITGWADTESELKTLGAMTQASADEMQKLEEVCSRTAENSTKSFSETVKAARSLAQLGYSGNDLTNLVPAVDKMSVATLIPQDLAAETIGATLHSFKLESGQATKVADELTAAMYSSALKGEDFIQIISKAGASMHAAGMKMEQTIAMAAVLRNTGMTAQETGTAIRAMSTKFARKKSMETFEKLDVDPQDEYGNIKEFPVFLNELTRAMKSKGYGGFMMQRDFAQVFGREHYAKAMALRNPLDYYKQLYKIEQGGKYGTAGVMRDVQMKGLSGALKLLMSKIDVFRNFLGRSLQQPVEELIRTVLIPLVDRGKSLVEIFTQLGTGKFKEMAGKMSDMIGNIIAPFKMEFTKFATGASSLASGFTSLVSAVGNATAALTGWAQRMASGKGTSGERYEKYREYFQKHKDRYAEAGTPITENSDWLDHASNWVTSLGVGIYNSAANIFTGKWLHPITWAAAQGSVETEDTMSKNFMGTHGDFNTVKSYNILNSAIEKAGKGEALSPDDVANIITAIDAIKQIEGLDYTSMFDTVKKTFDPVLASRFAYEMNQLFKSGQAYHGLDAKMSMQRTTGTQNWVGLMNIATPFRAKQGEAFDFLSPYFKGNKIVTTKKGLKKREFNGELDESERESLRQKFYDMSESEREQAKIDIRDRSNSFVSDLNSRVESAKAAGYTDVAESWEKEGELVVNEFKTLIDVLYEAEDAHARLNQAILNEDNMRRKKLEAYNDLGEKFASLDDKKEKTKIKSDYDINKEYENDIKTITDWVPAAKAEAQREWDKELEKWRGTTREDGKFSDKQIGAMATTYINTNLDLFGYDSTLEQAEKALEQAKQTDADLALVLQAVIDNLKADETNLRDVQTIDERAKESKEYAAEYRDWQRQENTMVNTGNKLDEAMRNKDWTAATQAAQELERLAEAAHKAGTMSDADWNKAKRTEADNAKNIFDGLMTQLQTAEWAGDKGRQADIMQQILEMLQYWGNLPGMDPDVLMAMQHEFGVKLEEDAEKIKQAANIQMQGGIGMRDAMNNMTVFYVAEKEDNGKKLDKQTYLLGDIKELLRKKKADDHKFPQ